MLSWAKALLAVAVLGLSTPALAQSPQLALQNDGREFGFLWQAAQFGDRTEPHAALIVPVQIEGAPKTLYMQFDLGAPSTVLMKDKLDSLTARLPGLAVGADGAVSRFVFSMGDVRAARPRTCVSCRAAPAAASAGMNPSGSTSSAPSAQTCCGGGFW